MEFDFPCYKVLASNDTSGAPGHQGGIVVPKDISGFFPELPAVTSTIGPTVDIELLAELQIDGSPVGEVKTRYQHQTWGGKRSPERRLTSNLGPIRDKASENDILLIQRSLTDPKRIRLNLVRSNSAVFSALMNSIGNKRWGVLNEKPSSQQDYVAAITDIEKQSQEPFVLFGKGVKHVVSTAKRIARDRAFQKVVLSNFGQSCAITGRTLKTPSGANGIDAAHIVPLASNGTDDVRNGLALSKELHWAFDFGLIAFEDNCLRVATFAKKDGRSDYLCGFEGARLRDPSKMANQPSSAAFEWHRQNVFLG